ncbi:MAG: DoxX-like family protein [Bernardetiaceae bacterium]|jgi:hypothetical protein|nr:DoxX-like family protein [Bernardetiaceae bacterium]
MRNLLVYRSLTLITATIWLVNGLICKVLNLVPRHQQIVASILGEAYARPLTLLIGLAELVMTAWVLSGYQRRLQVWTQITIVLLMNLLEFWLTPHLLLWGRWNLVFAALFAALVYVNESQIRPQR